MTTLNEMIEIIRAENPNGLRVGSDQTGYTDLTDAEYEVKIAEWANARLDKEEQEAKAQAALAAKAAAEAKLEALGLTPADIAALGL